MSYCNNCGAYIPDGYDECTACGTLTYEAQKAKQQQQQQQQRQQQQQQRAASATQNQREASTSENARKEAVAAAAEAARKAAELAREEIRKAVEPNSKRSSTSKTYKKTNTSYKTGADRYYGTGSEERKGADKYYSSDTSSNKSTGKSSKSRYDYNEGPTKYSAEYDEDARENKSMGALCYLGPLLLVPLLTKPDSQFLRYHCNQGLVLTLFCILVKFTEYVPIIGGMMWLCGVISAVTMFIKGLKNASEGKRKPLPLIGEITIIK